MNTFSIMFFTENCKHSVRRWQSACLALIKKYLNFPLVLTYKTPDFFTEKISPNNKEDVEGK